MTGVAAVIVTASVWGPVPPALVALRVTVEAPALVGVPVMSPVVALSARPAGNPVALKVEVLILAAIRYLIPTPPWTAGATATAETRGAALLGTPSARGLDAPA